MSERPTGAEQPRQQPIAGDLSVGPGFPPPGYNVSMAALAAAEAAAQSGDVDAALDGELAALDGTAENVEERETRLREFLSVNFPNLPENALQIAIERCVSFEEGCRELFEDPQLVLSEEDAEDPSLQAELSRLAQRSEELADVEEEVAQLTQSRDTLQATADRNQTEVIPATEVELSAARTTEARARTDLVADESENATVSEDLATVRELQVSFERLKAEHGTIGALQMLLEGENAVQSSEMRVIVESAISTVRALVSAIPGKEDVVSRLLDQTGLSLGAASSNAAVADFLTAVDASEDLSDEEKEALRDVLNAEGKIATGDDANDVFENGAIETYIDENGVHQERRIPLQPGQRVPFGDGHELGVDGNGQHKAWISTEIGTYETNLPEDPTDMDMGHIIRTVQLRAKLHELNAASIFFNDVDALEYGGGHVEVHPHHFAITERFLDVVVRNQALAGNQLLQSDDLDQIDYLLQFHDRRGDLGGADVDPDRVLSDYRAQGIVDENGTLDWDRFAQLVDANRSSRYAESGFELNAA